MTVCVLTWVRTELLSGDEFIGEKEPNEIQDRGVKPIVMMSLMFSKVKVLVFSKESLYNLA